MLHHEVGRPTATLTAWRLVLLGPNGIPLPEVERCRENDRANRRLKMNLSQRQFSFYPVVGAGQHQQEDGSVISTKENSLLIQPVDDNMLEDVFINHVRELLFNPTVEPGAGPYTNTQFAAMVKLPSDPEVFLLHHTGVLPIGPQD
jgi:hypothetical protein